MIGAMRVAAFCDAPMQVLWPVGHYAQELARPRDFFAADFVDTRFEMDDGRIAALRDNAVHLADLPDADAMHACLDSGRNILVENARDPVVLPGETAKQAAERFVATAGDVPPSDKVLTHLLKFDAHAQGGTVTALHVRRGDIIADGRWSRRYWPSKYVPDDYYDVMIESAPDAAYAIFSDTPASIARFGQRHGIRAAADIMDLAELNGAQQDMAELLAISRCATVLAGSDSAFSSAASMIGGTVKLTLPDDMPDALRQEAEARLLARVRQGPAAFLNVHDFGQCAHRGVRVLERDGRFEEARAILTRAADDHLEVPHLTKNLLAEAIRAHDDPTTLRICAAERRARPLKGWQFVKPSVIKHHIRGQMVAAFAYAGLGQDRRAVECLCQMALLQHSPGPLDMLSLRLRPHLEAGAFACPPTTLIRFEDGQIHPRGIQSIVKLHKVFQARFLDGEVPLNWQTALLLDWDLLTFAGRRDLMPKPLRHIASAGRDGDDPMALSLAALALVQQNKLKKAQQAVDRAAQLAAADRPAAMARALIAKRQAQVALAHGAFDTAEGHMMRALDLTDHPAFPTWWAKVEMANDRHAQGLARVQALPDPPFYALWILFKNAPKADEAGDSAARDALRDRFIACFDIDLPAAQDQAAE